MSCATRPTTSFCPRSGSVTFGLVLANARPAPQKEVVGRSMCYPSTQRRARTHRRRHSGYLLTLVPPLYFHQMAGPHSQPEGNGAASRTRVNCSGSAGTFSAVCTEWAPTERTFAIREVVHTLREVVHTLESHTRAYNEGTGKHIVLFPRVHFKTSPSFSPALGRFTQSSRNGKTNVTKTCRENDVSQLSLREATAQILAWTRDWF